MKAQRRSIERGIRVNCISLGPVWTPLNPTDRSAPEVAKLGQDSDMQVAQRFLRTSLAGTRLLTLRRS